MRIGFVGDIALGDHPKTVGFGFGSRYARGIPDPLAARLRPPGPAPDLMFGNLEFPLVGDAGGAALAERQCRGAGEYASFLALAGIHALNVATNHTYQHGPSGFHDTVQILRAAGIHAVGTPADFTDAGVLHVRRQRVALLGWCDRPRQYTQDPPPYNEFSERAYSQIAEARLRADIVVASIHWGDEFVLVPSDRERAIARAMIDAGAAIVVGHHPHVVREVERYRQGVIAYSLGNFIGDMVWDPRTRLSAWLAATVEQGAVAAELTPAVIDGDYFPRPLTVRERERLLPTITAAGRNHRSRVLANGYGAVAEAERRRHVRRTAWMMLRNFGRYPSGLAVEIVGGAAAHRLRRLLPGRSETPRAV
jgi:gamma-polyglutamate biosynthesis protein CapA